MAVIRGIVGFLSFMLAFAFKNAGAPLWQLGVVAATAQLGFFLGAVVAPRLRRLLTEERILLGALVVTTVGGVLTAFIGGLLGASILSMVVGATGSSAKQAFDSIVQRDAPDANRGRSFARFETRFQLIWVIGALIPIVVPVPAPVGFAMIGVASGVTVAWYLVGMRRIRQGRVPVRRRGWRRRPLYGPDAVEVDAVPAPPPPPPPPPPLGSRGRSTASRAGSSRRGFDATLAEGDVGGATVRGRPHRRGAVAPRVRPRPDRGRRHDGRRSPPVDLDRAHRPRPGSAMDAGSS